LQRIVHKVLMRSADRKESEVRSQKSELDESNGVFVFFIAESSP